MSKRYKIKWNEGDYQEIKRVVKNFNAKVGRLENKMPSSHRDAIPSKITAQDIISKVETRADLNKLLNKYKRFSKRGSEQLIMTAGRMRTRWERNEIAFEARAVSQRRKARKEELFPKEVLISGKGTGQSRASMGKIREISLKPIKRNFDKMTTTEWEKFSLMLENEYLDSATSIRKMKTKEQYLKAMENVGYSQKLIDLVKQVSVETFVETIVMDENATFDFMYDEKLWQEHQEGLYEAWVEALNRQAKKE